MLSAPGRMRSEHRRWREPKFKHLESFYAVVPAEFMHNPLIPRLTLL